MVSVAQAEALASGTVYRRRVAWLDFDGDPVRAVEGTLHRTFSGTGDNDLDGETFLALNTALLDISNPQHSESGSGPVTATLSASLTDNVPILNAIGDRTKWRGRAFRMWLLILDAAGAPIGNPVELYSGKASSIKLSMDPKAGMVVSVQIESYLSYLTRPAGKGYNMQAEFDPGDRSADATYGLINPQKQAPNIRIGGGNARDFDIRLPQMASY